MRKEPKVGGGVGGTCKVTKDQTQHSPRFVASIKKPQFQKLNPKPSKPTMASSSKRPRTSKSKQGESSSKSNPLNLTRLLANDAQRKVFEENFHGCAIFTPKYGNIGNFEFEDFPFPYLSRQQKHSDFCCEVNNIYPELVSDIELQLMYAIKYNIKINWAKMIMQQMWHICGSQSLLPYAIIITKILEHFGVSLDGETKLALNLRESKVDVEVIHKMGFVIDPVTRRTYKHRTDRQTAPTDQPEPTAPNLPESHAPSSSSTAMPSNQMIIDEMVPGRECLTWVSGILGYTEGFSPERELSRLSESWLA
ncbi:hypothetical protein Lal_00039691 [Lupinus albus]|nr:hypothetical protein Lal_00039691 [Lupinus albus]